MLWPYILTNSSCQMCTFCYLIYKQNNIYLTQKKESNWGNLLKTNMKCTWSQCFYPDLYILCCFMKLWLLLLFSFLGCHFQAVLAQYRHSMCQPLTFTAAADSCCHKGVNKGTRNHCFPKSTELYKDWATKNQVTACPCQHQASCRASAIHYKQEYMPELGSLNLAPKELLWKCCYTWWIFQKIK